MTIESYADLRQRREEQEGQNTLGCGQVIKTDTPVAASFAGAASSTTPEIISGETAGTYNTGHVSKPIGVLVSRR